MSPKLDNATVKYRIPTIFIVLVIVLIIIAILLIGFLSGIFEVMDLVLNFVGFISMLVSITTLAIVGAIFLGMYLSHRILTKRGFTPFEISMLEMHEDVREIKKRLGKLEKELQSKKDYGK
ncbi:hypothetical protein [[Eubacterium] cellulosolvens]